MALPGPISQQAVRGYVGPTKMLVLVVRDWHAAKLARSPHIASRRFADRLQAAGSFWVEGSVDQAIAR